MGKVTNVSILFKKDVGFSMGTEKPVVFPKRIAWVRVQ